MMERRGGGMDHRSLQRASQKIRLYMGKMAGKTILLPIRKQTVPFLRRFVSKMGRSLFSKMAF